jgi:protein SCO1/2
LEKVARVVEGVKKAATASKAGNGRLSVTPLVPVFITIDPSRDDVARTNEYVKEFHPSMIGLTGSERACADAARKYRVYFRKTGDEAAKEDYLVDHSIITYLIDPNGDFVTFYGKNTTDIEVTASVLAHMEEFYADKTAAAAA